MGQQKKQKNVKNQRTKMRQKDLSLLSLFLQTPFVTVLDKTTLKLPLVKLVKFLDKNGTVLMKAQSNLIKQRQIKTKKNMPKLLPNTKNQKNMQSIKKNFLLGNKQKKLL